MFSFLQTFHPSPILTTVGPFMLRWYGLLLAVAVAVGYAIVMRLLRHTKLSEDATLTAFLVTLVVSLLGARLYHVLNEAGYYWHHPSEIAAIWHGGLAIHGAFIAGFFSLLFFARRMRVSVFSLTDLFVIPLALGQAIGRWGNYFNQELFGRPTALPWGITIDPANRPVGYEQSAFFHPTFLYESLLDLVVFFVLLLLFRRQHRAGTPHTGVLTMTYLVAISVIRFSVESFRIDATPVILGVRLPMIVSALLAIAGVVGFVLLRRRRHQGATA